MKRLSLLVALAAIALLPGCATNEYAKYSDGQAKIEAARSNADAAKYKALAEIAASGDTTAKVAAVVALTSMQSQQQGGAQLRPPQPSSALQWAQIVVPSLTQVGGIWANVKLGMRQSDNAARVAESTNATFLGMASQIQAPAANVTTTNSVGDYSGTSSGNSGRIAGGDVVDSTHAPTVVTQPAPLVVTQPPPTVVTQPAPVIVTQPPPLVVPPTVVYPQVIKTTP